MASLYNRATPSQTRILRIIEGAIVNAAHVHEEIKISPRHRRSIAKRATGMLSSQWPEVLSATRRSEKSRAKDRPSKRPEVNLRPSWTKALNRQFTSVDAADKKVGNLDSEAGQKYDTSVPLLPIMLDTMRASVGPIRKSGDEELYEAVVNVLKVVGSRKKYG